MPPEKDLVIVRIRKTACPACGYALDAHSEYGEVEIEDEADDTPVSVCLNCGEILLLGDDMTPRQASDDEILDMPALLLQMLAKMQKNCIRNRGS